MLLGPVPAPIPRVSVVVPAHRAAGHIEACLLALRQQSAPPATYEILVVDDASPDATAELALRAGASLVRHESNRGAAAARNSGARAARGEVLLFVDSDVLADVELVAAVDRIFADPSIRAATGRYDKAPANTGAFPRYKALWTFWCWERTAVTSGESGHLQGALAALRRDVFLESGGFDERYEGGNVEDYELSQRLRERGVRIAFDARIRGRHRFPGFGTAARNYWDRTRMWTRLHGRARKGSSGQANPRSAVAALMAFGGAAARGATLIAPPLLPLTLPAALLCDAGYLAAAAPFLAWVARSEGPAFALYAGGVHWALSAVVGAAALSAPFGEGSRRRRGNAHARHV
jgi:hypothetical protein